MRRPTQHEVFWRVIQSSPPINTLEAIVRYAYDRFDGDQSVGRSRRYRRSWEIVGDRADDLRCWWIKRPVWRG